MQIPYKREDCLNTNEIFCPVHKVPMNVKEIEMKEITSGQLPYEQSYLYSVCPTRTGGTEKKRYVFGCVHGCLFETIEIINIQKIQQVVTCSILEQVDK